MVGGSGTRGRWFLRDIAGNGIVGCDAVGLVLGVHVGETAVTVIGYLVSPLTVRWVPLP